MLLYTFNSVHRAFKQLLSKLEETGTHMPKKEILDDFVARWMLALNNDTELRFRLRHPQCNLEGKPVLSIHLRDVDYSCTIFVKQNAFYWEKALSSGALLSISLPLESFKRLLLTEDRVLDVLLLDEQCTSNFNDEAFDHFNGTTILELLVVAQEIVDADEALRRQIMSL